MHTVFFIAIWTITFIKFIKGHFPAAFLKLFFCHFTDFLSFIYCEITHIFIIKILSNPNCLAGAVTYHQQFIFADTRYSVKFVSARIKDFITNFYIVKRIITAVYFVHLFSPIPIFNYAFIANSYCLISSKLSHSGFSGTES